MKIKLLTLTAGIGFSLCLLNTIKVNAQIRAYENFEYGVSSNYIGQNGGLGWANSWYSNGGSLFSNIIEGNLEGAIGATGVVGGQWTSAFRQLSTPWINTAGNVLWTAFTFKSNSPLGASGAAYFSGNYEHLYFGRLPGDLIGLGSVYQNPACIDPNSDAYGTVLTSDAPHYYLAKITGLGSYKIRIDFWVDYDGLTEPLTDSNLEPTYQNFGYRKNVDGINVIRICGYTEPSEANTLYSTFDAIRLSSTFFSRGDTDLDGISDFLLVPLELTSLTAKSTASGNLVSWISVSSKNVKSLTVLRKDALGAFVSIADNLSATQTSFTDTNPLDGTNYYKLRSIDIDGKTKTYDLIATDVGFDAEASFYPNPVTNGELNIVAGKESLKSVAIFDLSGKKVAFKTVVGKSTKISTQDIAKGIYILEVSGSKTNSRNKLVIE